MQPKTPKLLEDIRDATAFVTDVTRGVSEVEYQHNRLLCQGIERNFEIIGEAIRRLTQHDLATAQRINGYAQIIAFRNILIHGYDQIDHRVVWQVIQRDLPLLLTDVVTLLARVGQDEGPQA
jgi:uncharacterized protein with HEPN domain